MQLSISLDDVQVEADRRHDVLVVPLCQRKRTVDQTVEVSDRQGICLGFIRGRHRLKGYTAET